MIDTATYTAPGQAVRDVERIHVSDGSHDRIIVKFGSMTSLEFCPEAAVMLNHAEARLLRRRLKAALKGNPRPDEVQ